MPNKTFFGLKTTSITAIKYLMGYVFGFGVFILLKPESDLISRLAEFIAPLALGVSGCLLLDISEGLLDSIFKRFKKETPINEEVDSV